MSEGTRSKGLQAQFRTAENGFHNQSVAYPFAPVLVCSVDAELGLAW